MLYLNQLEHAHVPYITNTKNDEVVDKVGNVARSGCGPCCLCMTVDALTTKTLPIEECIKLSEGCGANYGRGTDMSMLAPVVAERFALDYRNTDEQAEMLACLQTGGAVIAHVRRMPDDEVGLFTKSGHYISVISTDGETVCILDPSYTPEKFHTPEREGRVDDSHAPFVYCDVNVLHADTEDAHTKYHLFSRKK